MNIILGTMSRRSSLLLKYCLFTASIVLFSCTKMMIQISSSISGVKNLKMVVNYDLNDTIVFIPMMHVSTEGFFKDVKILLDSLRADGFVVFYEGDEEEHYKNLTKGQLDTLLRKTRTLYDFKMYDEWSLADKSFEVQDNEKLIIKGKDINADISIKESIDLYEYHYGEIELTECDWNTPLMAEYTCKKKSFRMYKFATGARDEYLFDVIITSPHPKKVILYGASHWYRLYPKLRSSGYELIKGKV